MRRRVVLVCVAAAALFQWRCGARSELAGAGGNSDGATLDVRATEDAKPIQDSNPITCQGAFQPPEAITSLDTERNEQDIRFTPDELVAYFASNRLREGGGTGDVFVARRASLTLPFEAPELVAGMSNPNDIALNPNITPDELTLIFDDGACWSCCGATQILCSATRPSTSVSFGVPTSVYVPQAGPLQFAGGAYSLDSGLTLYFQTSHAPNWIGVSRRAHITDKFGSIAPVAIDGIDASTALGSPVVTEDELTLFFSRDAATPSYGAIWEAIRVTTSSAFGAPSLISELQTPKGEYPNWISPDGCRLYFTRAIPTDDAGNWQLDLYVSSRSP